MKKITAIFLLLFSTKTFAQTIPFQLLPSGHMIVQASVEGHEGNFIFDTGAGINLFFTDFAKNLNQQSTYNFFSAFRATGERIDAPLYHSKELLFGNKKFLNIPYTTFDMQLEGINGLISLPMFSETDFVIDYDKNEIRFTDLDSNKYKKSFEIQTATLADNSLDIFTYITINKQYTIKVLLDSGAGNDSFWLSERLLDVLDLDPDNMELTEKASEFDPSKKLKIYNGTIQSLSTPYSIVENQRVNFVEGLIYEGKTSINWLGNKIGISLKNKRIYILD